MGYYTNYEVSVENGSIDLDELKISLEEFSKYVFYNFKLNQATWYEHESDMREVSVHYPNIVLALHGEGEEAKDMWCKYFKNGKMQICKAVVSYLPYDEGLLK